MPINPDKKTFNVTVPLATYNLLKRWADGKDWNVSQAARNIIAEALGKEYGFDPEELREGKVDLAQLPKKTRGKT